MGRRQHEPLETDTLLARKDEEISALDARLHQTITHLSLVRARLLSTLDQLDVLQQEHTAALATAARQQQRLEVKLRAAEEMARLGEADRMDMRDAVATLVKKVEATPDFRNWPRSQIHLSSSSEPSRHSLTHQPAFTSPSVSPTKSHRHNFTLPSNHNSDAGRTAPHTEQLAYASTLISHVRAARDTALLRAERSETRVPELEARLARREAALAACSCAGSVTRMARMRPSDAGQIRTQSKDERGRGSPPGRTVDPWLSSSRRKPRHEHGLFPVDANVGTSDILDVSIERNKELEREVQALSRQLDRVRVVQDSRSSRGTKTNSSHSSTHIERGAHTQQAHEDPLAEVYLDRATPRICTPPSRHQHLHQEHQHSPPPLTHHQHDGDASLLSSLSFSPSSTATSSGTGEATPRQYEYEYHDPYGHAEPDARGGVSDSEDAYEDVFRDTGEDESLTQLVGLNSTGKPFRHLQHDFQGDDGLQAEYNDAFMKAIPVPVPSLHALHRQIALLGEKIDAFAVERRWTAVDASRRAGMGGGGNRQLRADLVSAYENEERDEDGDGQRPRGVGERKSAHESWGGGNAIDDRVQQEEEGEGSGRDSRTHLQHIDSGAESVSQHGPSGDGIHEYDNAEDDEQGNDQDPECIRTTLAPPGPLPLPLPMPLSLPMPLPQTQARSPPPPSPPRHSEAQAQEPGNTYDHPHETCEATLLAARKRETQLTERVRVLEGALAVVEAQVRRRGAMDAAAAQAPPAQDECEVYRVDVAVQTLLLVPQTSVITLAPVSDLLGLDVSDLPVLEGGSSVRGVEGEHGSEQEANAEYGEMPMELATPLWPVSALPIAQEGRGTGDGSDASSHGHVPEEIWDAQAQVSDDDGGLTKEGQQAGGCDGDEPVFLNEDVSSPEIDEISSPVNLNQPLEQGTAESLMTPSPLPAIPAPAPSATQGHPSTPPPSTRRSASPPAQLRTPSPPSSTGTSPTLAVGLLPPLPPHAHLSLPASLLFHSHHTTSLSSPLLSAPNTHAHSGLRRAHTDSDIGMASTHAQQAESAHRFVMYRATSSFVAELREAESRLAEVEVRDVNQNVRCRADDAGDLTHNVPDAQARTDTERHDAGDQPPSPLLPSS